MIKVGFIMIFFVCFVFLGFRRVWLWVDFMRRYRFLVWSSFCVFGIVGGDGVVRDSRFCLS